MRNNSLSILFESITKLELPKVVYLLHHERFPIFIANADTIETATIGGGTFQLENTTGIPIAAGRIKRFKIVPSSNGNLAPEVFNPVIEWVCTGNYTGTPYSFDEKANEESTLLDKKVAIASLLMGEEDLLVIAIQKLRVRMDLATTADRRKTKQLFEILIDALIKNQTGDVSNDADDEATDETF